MNPQTLSSDSLGLTVNVYNRGNDSYAVIRKDSVIVYRTDDDKRGKMPYDMVIALSKNYIIFQENQHAILTNPIQKAIA